MPVKKPVRWLLALSYRESLARYSREGNLRGVIHVFDGEPGRNEFWFVEFVDQAGGWSYVGRSALEVLRYGDKVEEFAQAESQIPEGCRLVNLSRRFGGVQ